MKRIVRWIYLHLPFSFRVWGNSKKTELMQKYFKQQRGRLGPAREEDYMCEHHGRMIEGHLSARVIRANGKIEARDLGGDKFAEGPNTVTDAGVAYMVDDWDAGTNGITLLNYHEMGTGGSPPSTPGVAATALVTPVESRSAGTKSQPAANQIRSVATITATAPRTINEWGLFSQLASGGTMWSTRWFTAISLASGDAIEFTYTLTISSFTA